MPKGPAIRTHPKSEVEAPRSQGRQPKLWIHLKHVTPMQTWASLFKNVCPKSPHQEHPKSAVEARRHQDRQPNLLIHLKSDTPMQAGASFFKRMPKGPAQRAHPKVRGRSLEAQRPTTNILNKCQKCNSLADGNATCRTYMSKEPAPRAHPKSEVEAYNPTLFSSLDVVL